MLIDQGMTNGLAESNLRERVLHQLRLDIVSGEIAAGSVFSVPGLARSLGISTTPVREALLQLAADGLLVPLRNRGFQVANPTLDELRDLFEVRVQLEVAAFVKLVGMGLTNVDVLQARADDIAQAVADGNISAYLAADRAFHLELMARAGNATSTDIVMKLRDKMRLYGIRSVAGRTRQKRSIAEHYRIVDLVAGRRDDDPDALMTRHIMEWEPIFVAAIQKGATGKALAADNLSLNGAERLALSQQRSGLKRRRL